MTPAIATTTLADLATTINEAYQAATEAATEAVQHAIRCGHALIEAKEQVEHGKWLPWLQANCPEVSARTAQRWCQLARSEDRLVNASRVSHLSIRGALELLAGDGKPEEEESPQRTLPEIVNEVLPGLSEINASLAARLERDDLTIAEVKEIRDRALEVQQIAGEFTVRLERALGQLLSDVE